MAGDAHTQWRPPRWRPPRWHHRPAGTAHTRWHHLPVADTSAGDAHTRWHSYRGALRGVSPRTREGRNGPTVPTAVASGQWPVVGGQELQGPDMSRLLLEGWETAPIFWDAPFFQACKGRRSCRIWRGAGREAADGCPDPFGSQHKNGLITSHSCCVRSLAHRRISCDNSFSCLV